MTISILICDDSSFARKQIARALSPSLLNKVTFAANGEEAMKVIRDGKVDLLLLDLNMPIMDGYEVLQHIRSEDLNTLVVVVSGDVQPDAYKRVLALGAMEFIKKPVKKETLHEVLDRFGIRAESSGENNAVNVETDCWDGYKEIANVAMGQAADLIARLLGVFVNMPIPLVNMTNLSKLSADLKKLDQDEWVSSISQGYIGGGVSGEALLVFRRADFKDIASMMKHKGELTESAQQELLMDIGSVMISAFLKGFANQLDISFSQGSPVLLESMETMSASVAQKKLQESKILSIEHKCSIEGCDVECDLILFFTDDSLDPMDNIISLLAS